MNFCKDCKHFKWDILIDECKHPEVSPSDPVHGGQLRTTCYFARNNSNYCGEQGLHFEKKPDRIRELLNKLRGTK